MEKIQEKVKKFNADYNLENSLEFAALDLVSEVGEIAKEILESSNYGKEKPKYREELKNEIGDAFYSLIVLSNFYDISLKKALDKALEKYEKRFNKKGEIGSSYEK